MGTALFALTYGWQAVRPLRDYFLILTMTWLLPMGLSRIQATPLWIAWFGPERSWLVYFFGDRLGIVLIALTLAGILALLTGRGRDLADSLLGRWLRLLGNDDDAPEADGEPMPTDPEHTALTAGEWQTSGELLAAALADAEPRSAAGNPLQD